MSVVNLTALAESRAKMTPGEYKITNRQTHIDANNAWHTIDQANGPDVIVQTMAGHAPRSIANAAGLVAEHNAMPVLIDVARTGVELVAAENEQALTSTDDGWARLCDARRAHAMAIAKVSL